MSLTKLWALTVYDELPLVLQGRVREFRVLGSTGHRLSVVGGSRPEHQRGHRHVPVVQKLDGTTRVFLPFIALTQSLPIDGVARNIVIVNITTLRY